MTLTRASLTLRPSLYSMYPSFVNFFKKTFTPPTDRAAAAASLPTCARLGALCDLSKKTTEHQRMDRKNGVPVEPPEQA